MPTFTLMPHPTTPCEFIRAINVQAIPVMANALRLRYAVSGDLRQLVVPESRRPARTDGLWRDTCFEIFLRPAQAVAYQEFNFAPSGAWAAYSFTSHRQGMKPLELAAPPRIVCRSTEQSLEVTVELQSPLLGGIGMRAALSAVLKLRDGTVLYWALAHAAGQPDFHADTGFAATGLRIAT